MEVPSDVLGRFVAIPKGKDPQGKVYILIDDVIRACLPRAFRGVFDIQSADAYWPIDYCQRGCLDHARRTY